MEGLKALSRRLRPSSPAIPTATATATAVVAVVAAVAFAGRCSLWFSRTGPLTHTLSLLLATHTPPFAGPVGTRTR